MPTTHLLYLHGFRSSPQSFKSRRLQDWLQAHRPDVLWCAPQLPPSPSAAWQLINEVTAGWPAEQMAVVGSSLGGFYATALAEARGCRALLLNPAVQAARDLAPYVGELSYFHAPQDRFDFRAEYIDELRALTVPAITRPERYAALIAKGDEVLDWREMSGRYPGASIRLLEGSDHGLSDFDAHLPWVLQQLHLA
ncbi:YqiA/YcfP family alpha/beta fold hydrolase [Aquabacterium sp.]|uniref:YqiA/YcfP family alpha/beta fold hydrolase n=1 Tax=Aquabacterium sp. TaxID=1872578 RepID=UPI002B51331E|nr:YqiA/YcfP family alpha/beta fold hydrolase [Aquabacterium sp.]HSW08192.1 YqiA/YcfP family alpha/beta fold hydrolase [Aquabacterium sp.]